MKISKILHLAADEYLWDGVDSSSSAYNSYSFSCGAIQAVCRDYKINFNRIEKGLEEMGLYSQGVYPFIEFSFGKERQAARYLWLKWAALMAEEQEKFQGV